MSQKEASKAQQINNVKTAENEEVKDSSLVLDSQLLLIENEQTEMTQTNNGFGIQVPRSI